MNKLKKIPLLSSLFFLVLIGCNNNDNNSSQNSDEIALLSQETRKVVEHHLEAFIQGDVDKTLEDYTDDSVLISEGINEQGYVKGLAQIRANFENVYANYFPPTTTNFTLETMTVSGETAHITWTSATTDYTTDTFVVRNGKIVAQTFAAKYKQ